MRRLQLDYVAPPRRPRWPGFALLALSFAVAGALVDRYVDLQGELQRLEAARGLLGAERRPARAVTAQQLAEQTKGVETVVRQLALPWAALVESVEGAAHPDVALLQLQPDAPQRLLRLSAEAKDREAMLEYVRRLGQAKLLHEAHLVSHQVQSEEPRRPIQFAVQAAFRSAP